MNVLAVIPARAGSKGIPNKNIRIIGGHPLIYYSIKNAISSKYIIPGITSNQAIMFLPAEALFAEINAYHTDLIEYANQRNVWITSPTTLMATFTIIQVLLKNMERDKYATIIHQELNKLGLEFARYKERWDKLSRSIETVNKDVENINITTDKITKRFESISNVNLEKINKENNLLQ